MYIYIYTNVYIFQQKLKKKSEKANLHGEVDLYTQFKFSKHTYKGKQNALPQVSSFRTTPQHIRCSLFAHQWATPGCKHQRPRQYVCGMCNFWHSPHHHRHRGLTRFSQPDVVRTPASRTLASSAPRQSFGAEVLGEPCSVTQFLRVGQGVGWFNLRSMNR